MGLDYSKITLTFDGDGNLVGAAQDGKAVKVVKPPDGPSMLHLGREDGPVSVFEVQARQRGGSIPEGQVPVRGLGDPFGPDRVPEDTPFDFLERAEVHKRLATERNGRGRKPTASLETAAALKRSYWRGDDTLRNLAKTHGVSAQTASRIANGAAFWWA